MAIKFQDRLMFASDAHKEKRWENYEKIIEHYRKMISSLPQEVAEKISFKNAERIYGIKIE